MWRIALIPNYAFNPIAEQALRSNQTIVPQRVNAALGPMRIFRRKPEHPYGSLFLGLLGGTLVGAFLFALVDVVIFGASLDLKSGVPGVVGVWMSGIMLGSIVVVVYVLPVLFCLVRIGYAGPASGLIVAMLPAIVLAIYGDVPKVITVVTLFSISSYSVFSYFAYVRRGA